MSDSGRWRAYHDLMIPSVYIAGPLGFTESGQFFYSEVVLPQLRSLRVTLLDPWASAASVFAEATAGRIDFETANLLVGRRNEEMIRASDLVVAILDGSDVDSGTAAEIGYAVALNKPVIGIRSDMRMSGDNLATPVNLQVAYFIERSGGEIVSSLEKALGVIANSFALPPSQ